jgi:hypothetical protein
MDSYEVTASDTFGLLRKIISETKGPPDWSFRLVNEGGAFRLVITLDTVDSYDPEQPKRVAHYHPVPITTYNEKTWRRWIFEQCLRTMNHELGETLRFGADEVRPFVPMHGPGEDPYTVHEWRSEEDARTDQRGNRREGAV